MILKITKRILDKLQILFLKQLSNADNDVMLIQETKTFGSSRPMVFCKKGPLKNFSKFAENTCNGVSILTKLQAGGLDIAVNFGK